MVDVVTCRYVERGYSVDGIKRGLMVVVAGQKKVTCRVVNNLKKSVDRQGHDNHLGGFGKALGLAINMEASSVSSCSLTYDKRPSRLLFAELESSSKAAMRDSILLCAPTVPEEADDGVPAEGGWKCSTLRSLPTDPHLSVTCSP